MLNFKKVFEILSDIKLKQCVSCEHVFRLLDDGMYCPRCKSGNWVYGYIDDYIEKGEC